MSSTSSPPNSARCGSKRCAAGARATLAAVNTARVHKLVMQRNLHTLEMGLVRQGCTGATAPAQRVQCSGEVTLVELGEAMVQAVLQADGLVEPIAPDDRLAAYEGVGALLRYQ